MTLINYHKTQFHHDLEKLAFTKPNSTILSYPNDFRVDVETKFWGGRDWENVVVDLAKLEPTSIENFLLSLFSITLIDMGLCSQFGDIHSYVYFTFRQVTKYPKFGWCGLGPHYESTKKILNIPEQLKLSTFSNTRENPKDFSIFFENLCNKIFEENKLNISTRLFITNLMDDNDLKVEEVDKGTIYEIVHKALENIITK